MWNKHSFALNIVADDSWMFDQVRTETTKLHGSCFVSTWSIHTCQMCSVHQPMCGASCFPDGAALAHRPWQLWTPDDTSGALCTSLRGWSLRMPIVLRLLWGSFWRSWQRQWVYWRRQLTVKVKVLKSMDFWNLQVALGELEWPWWWGYALCTSLQHDAVVYQFETGQISVWHMFTLSYWKSHRVDSRGFNNLLNPEWVFTSTMTVSRPRSNPPCLVWKRVLHPC